jgi:hypothetical protein
MRSEGVCIKSFEAKFTFAICWNMDDDFMKFFCLKFGIPCLEDMRWLSWISHCYSNSIGGLNLPILSLRGTITV